MVLEEMNNSQLTALVEIVKPSRIIGFTKADMINSLKRYGDSKKVLRGMEIVYNGIDYVEARYAKASGTEPMAIAPDLSEMTKLVGKLESKVDTLTNALKPNLPTLDQEVLPEEFPRIIKRAAARLNVALVGPAGCGKTHVSALVAKALGLSFGSLSVSFGMPRSDILGQFVPIGKRGSFEYVASNFINKYENGGVFLIDEGDNGDPNTMGTFNQALANDHFDLPGRRGNHRVNRHPDFVCIIAMNTYGQGADMKYVGRAQLDAATLDRFKAGTVTMDYSPAVETALVNPDVLRWGRRIRANIERTGLNHIMSTRCMLNYTKLAAMGDTENDWTDSYFQGVSTADKSRMQA